MLKIRTFWMLLLAAAMLLQGFTEARATETDCCPSDCQPDGAYCLMPGSNGMCGACSSGAVVAGETYNTAACNISTAAINVSASEFVSANTNAIWRPPIVA